MKTQAAVLLGELSSVGSVVHVACQLPIRQDWQAQRLWVRNDNHQSFLNHNLSSFDLG